LTRHELKEQLQHDHFTDAVSDILGYAVSNRERLVRWIIAVVVVLALVGAAFWYAAYRRSVRQHDLQAAFDVLETPVGPPSQFANSYPTQDAKLQASIKALSNVVAKDGGSREGLIAQYYLGTLKVQKQDNKGAESDLRAVADSSSECASLAKVALAQLLASENRMPEAQALLRGMINKPTDLVSKAQAQVLLARLEETSNPKEARSILQSLRSAKNQDPAVTRAIDQLSSQLTK
jgi:predicted negative regulator of RcsB-dependent stress response